MKNKENIDELLAKALSEEDSEILDRIGEQGLFDLMAANFQGKLKWIAYYSMFIMLLFTGGMFYSLVKFLNVVELREMILWGAAMFGSMMIVTMLKIWHWMQMDKNALLREIKRLELQISILAKK